MKHHSGRTILVGLAFFALFRGECANAQKPGLFTNEITTVTVDSLTLHGWITYTPQRAKAAMIVCLPMMGHDHSSYDDFVQTVIEGALLAKTDVPYILTVDLRGHGRSTQHGHRTISVNDLANEDFANFPSDVAAIIHAAIRDTTYRIDTTDIRIVGASIGANTAPWVAPGVAGVTKVVMLSPGEDYRGIEPSAALKAFKGLALMVASEKDSYSYQSVRTLSKVAPSANVLTYSGTAHGTDIINSEPGAMKAVVAWLMKN